MFYDALTLRAYAAELMSRFPPPWFVQKISQVGELDFLLSFRLGPKNNLRLLLSLQPNQPSLRWWRGPKPLAGPPSSFTMLCRKYLQGRSIDRLEVLYPERALRLVGRDYSLVIELLERQPNVLLVSATGLIAGGRHLGRHSERDLRVRRTYTPPPQAGLPDASTLTAYQLEEFYLADPPGFPASLATRTFGLSPAACQRLGLLLDPSRPLEERLQAGWREFWKFTEGGYSAERLSNGRLSMWGQGPPQQLLDLEEEQAPALPALETARHRALQKLKKAQARLRQRLVKMDEDKARLGQADVLQRQGELLLTYQHQVKQGMESITLTDWDGQTQHVLKLDPAVPTVKQAQKWLKRASKYRRSAPIIEARVAETDRELAQIQEAVFAVEQAESLADLQELQAPPQSKKPERPRAGPRRYELDQFVLLVGRSPRQNDELIRRHSARDDLWFHVKDSPGAHVLLKTAGRRPDDMVVESAAQVAAYYSSRAKDSRVLVSFTSAQRVKKPKESAPGLVVYSDELTLWVDPGQLNAKLLRCD